MRITPQIANLLKKEAACHRLNLKQTKLLRRYKLSRSSLVVTCNTCRMVSKYPGEGRRVVASSPGTPKAKRNFGSPDLGRPGSNRKVNLSYSEEKLSSQTRSPVLTPRYNPFICYVPLPRLHQQQQRSPQKRANSIFQG
ncbi:hypothetical protein GDO78_017476 [Eleutherodactylus coqui]|uniref:Uncharacterized protein n=2 Tax=Eleutherodactylus coqui TaxID=57060 RepID=A0A8J6EJU4_ELECQ|nr:hypothetical protein GDO78_017476 [Eleutherodactylus coqui]